jgi:hypothetical protein
MIQRLWTRKERKPWQSEQQGMTPKQKQEVQVPSNKYSEVW